MEGSVAPLLAFEKRPYITECPVLFFLYPLFQKKNHLHCQFCYLTVLAAALRIMLL
jgi:hypothetical protein